jgi:branched-chain amino acid transport system ATP-binding protein
MTALLEVTELCVDFGGLRAVDEVSMLVRNGMVMGLIGPNGAGKTTTIDALCGFVARSSGSVTLAGRPIETLAPHQRARAGLVRTFQSVELFDDLTVRENLLVAATSPRWWSPFIDAVAPRRRAHDVDVDFALDMVGLRSVGQARPTELSHGQRRLAGVSRALAARPKLVLLDEPAAGLDPTETAALGALLRALPAAGVGVLLVDHDMSLVLDICDELTVLDFGRVIATGEPAVVREDPAVIAAYLGGVA